MASIEVVNISQQNPEEPIEIKLSTSNIFYRGPAGSPGQDGAPGRDGITPVKGVDYFTQQDINEFIAQVPAPDLSSYATKAEVETAIRGAESGLLKRAIVQTLPVQSIDDNTIYMVPKQGNTGDVYDEYLYVSNIWEHIGSTDVDLSNYATISMLNPFLTQQDVEDCVRILNLSSTSITEAINDDYRSLWTWFNTHTSLAIHNTNNNNHYTYTFNYFPFDIYIDGHKIQMIVYETDDVPNSSALFCGLYFYSTMKCEFEPDVTKYKLFVWEYNTGLNFSNHLSVYNRTYDATGFKVNASQLNGQAIASGMTAVDFSVAFKYIYDNYVRKADLSQELSNSDIQAIWNNSSGNQQGG